MPKGQKTKKNELMFSKPKVVDIMGEVNKLNLSVEQRRRVREALKEERKAEKVSVPVRLKLRIEELEQLKAYVELAQVEKKITENAKVGQSEIVSFALVKFLKGDSYFQEKFKTKDYPSRKNMPVERKK